VTYPDVFADLRPTEGELYALVDALGEVASEDPGGRWDPPPGEDDGPWDDEAALAAEMDSAMIDLANSGYDLDQLAGINETIELSTTAEALRQAEDAEDALALRPKFEDKLARAIDRLSRGTYLPAGMYAQGRDASGQFASHGCGPLDDFGRCSSRYHAGECFETFRGEAATGTAAAIDAWRGTLLSNYQAAVELSNAQADLDAQTEAALSGPNDVETYQAMRGILGLK
jgi:hypothetical protein